MEFKKVVNLSKRDYMFLMMCLSITVEKCRTRMLQDIVVTILDNEPYVDLRIAAELINLKRRANLELLRRAYISNNLSMEVSNVSW